ncbi:MAG: hypothetical protein ACE5EX_03380, partial [Phycisphaerae bacterium]
DRDQHLAAATYRCKDVGQARETTMRRRICSRRVGRAAHRDAGRLVHGEQGFVLKEDRHQPLEQWVLGLGRVVTGLCR